MGANSTTTSSGRRARLIRSNRPTTHPQRWEPHVKEATATVATEPVEAQGGSVEEVEIVEEALERAAMPVDRVD